jgi:hypothetical protein
VHTEAGGAPVTVAAAAASASEEGEEEVILLLFPLLLPFINTSTNLEAGNPNISAGTTLGRKNHCSCSCLKGIMYIYASIDTNTSDITPPVKRG